MTEEWNVGETPTGGRFSAILNSGSQGSDVVDVGRLLVRRIGVQVGVRLEVYSGVGTRCRMVSTLLGTQVESTRT